MHPAHSDSSANLSRDCLYYSMLEAGWGVVAGAPRKGLRDFWGTWVSSTVTLKMPHTRCRLSTGPWARLFPCLVSTESSVTS